MEAAMNKNLSHLQAVYGPMNFKNFPGALESFFAEECPQLGGLKTRQVLVQSITEMVSSFHPETSRMKQGQVLWTTVDRDEKCSYGKSMRNTRLTQVVLDLVRSQDAAERAEGRWLRDIKKEAVARIFNQSYQQGGCMTNAEVGILLKISNMTVGKYIKEWEAENNVLLPRRGTIHDMGLTLTHKREIIYKLFLEGKSVEDVSRETNHSHEAINRYITAFKQVLLCRRKSLSELEASFAVKMSKGLVREYWNLIDEMKSKSLKLDELLNILDKM
jgi:DNA-binding CsgD family transcriptional regulator